MLTKTEADVLREILPPDLPNRENQIAKIVAGETKLALFMIDLATACWGSFDVPHTEVISSGPEPACSANRLKPVQGLHRLLFGLGTSDSDFE